MKKLTLLVAAFMLPFLANASSLKISKELLGKDLILNSYAKKTNGLINFSKAYSVRFKKENGRLLLISQNKEINYEFDITSKSDLGIEVNLNEGLKRISFQSSIYKTELSLDHPQLKRYVIPSKAFKSIEVKNQKKDQLLITVFLAVPGYDYIEMELVPDNNKNFKAKLHTDEDKVGVYSTFPLTNGKKFAAKQELPLTYEYDESFPKELMPALKKAVKYWNKALGAKLIKLGKSTNKNRAQKVGVHYIDYYANRDSDGGARGVFNLHPLNGKILSSLIYVPSGFVVWGTKYFKEKYPQLDDKKVQVAVSDYLTHTLAHEIGHSLGLRHNFAASNESNIDSHNHAKVFDRYVHKTKVKKKVKPSSSVLDYISIDYFALMGAKMRLKQKPLSYDKKAVRWLYFNKTPKSFGDFCTHFDEPPSVEEGGSSFCQAWDEPHLNN